MKKKALTTVGRELDVSFSQMKKLWVRAQGNMVGQEDQPIMYLDLTTKRNNCGRKCISIELDRAEIASIPIHERLTYRDVAANSNLMMYRIGRLI